jgi:hypothetical protein
MLYTIISITFIYPWHSPRLIAKKIKHTGA